MSTRPFRPLQFAAFFQPRTKPSAFSRLLAAAVLVLCLGPQSARAVDYYWDTNGATAGSGAATGTWGTSTFWTTDSAGTIGTSAYAGDNTSDIFFSAGANGTTGTVTVLGTQSAHSITFRNPVAITLSGGTALNLGSATAGSGIFVTANAANTISTPVILNSAASAIGFSNSGTGLLTIGAVTGAAVSGTQTITVGSGSSGNIALNGVIGDGAGGGKVALTVNNTGTGITTLANLTNTFTGPLTLNGGTLLGAGNAFGAGSLFPSLILNSGTFGNSANSAVTIKGAVTLNGDIGLIGGTGVLPGTSKALSFTGNWTLTGNRALDVTTLASNNAVSISGIISGTGFSLTKNGTGVLNLFGNNTYSGGTIVNSGTLALANSGQVLAAGSALTINGGVFLASFGQNNIGTLTLNDGAIEAPIGSGFITASSYSLSNGTIDAGFSGTGAISKITTGTVALNAYGSGTGNVSLTSGVLRLGGAQRDATTQTVTTTSGTTTVTVADGTLLSVGQSLTATGIPANALIQSIVGNVVTINRTATASASVTGAFSAGGPLGTGGTISFSGGTLQHSAANQYDYSSRFSTAASQAYKIDTNGQNVTYASNLTSSGGSINKLGSGTLTLSAANSYSGVTTVTAGTLLIQGAQSGTGLVTVESNGTLGGNGSIAGSLSLLAGADFVFSLTDTLSVNGATVSFGGFGISDLVGLDSSVALGTYTLIDGTATFDFTNVSNFGSANAASIGGGKSAYFQAGSLQVVVVPEPTTLTLLAGGLALLLFKRARRRA